MEFFNKLEEVIIKLEIETKTKWGEMSPSQMLEHLIQSCKMIHQNNTKILIKKERIPKVIAFLYSDKEIQKGIKVDESIGYSFSSEKDLELEKVKTQLIMETKEMVSFLNTNPNFKAIHPYFGKLNAEQWILFQNKHFTHHLKQFGLL